MIKKQPKKVILDVLYQSDNNYAVVTGVSIVSLLENNKDADKIVINLIDGGITSANMAKIKQLVEQYGRTLRIIDGEALKQKLIEYKCRPYKGSYVTYYKLLAYDQIKAESGRILMLDGDILVQRSLSGVDSIDLGDNVMAEVVDPYMPTYLTKGIGIREDQPYFGAGVMLINQSVWKKDKCEKEITDHWKHKKSDYLFADQDITNILFGKRIQELHLKYNFYSKNYMLHPYERFVFRQNEAMLKQVYKEGPVCVHCIDESWRSRPWFKGNTHTMSPEWDRYLALSPWAGWDKLDTRLNKFHQIDKIAYRVLPRAAYALLLKSISAIFARLDISKRMLDSKKMNVKD